MNEANNPDDELKDLDLSSLSFAEFVDFFFAREIVSEEDLYESFLTDLRGEKYFDSVPTSPEIIVKHLTGLLTVLRSNRWQMYMGSSGPSYMGNMGTTPQLACATFTQIMLQDSKAR